MSELRDIMEKRRRKNNDEEEGSLSELPSAAELVHRQQHQHQHGSSASQFHGSARSWEPHSSVGSAGGGGGGMMSPDLKAAMERRRRLADSMPDLPRIDTNFDSPTGQHPSVVSPGGRTDAAASPVKSELKTVAMGADLQAIMARRRKLAGGSDDENEQEEREKAAATAAAAVVAPDLSESSSPMHRGSSHSQKLEGSPIKQGSSHSSKGSNTFSAKKTSTSTSLPSKTSKNKSIGRDQQKNEASASRPSLDETLPTTSPSKSRRKKSDDSTSKSSSASPQKPSRRLKSRNTHAGSSDEQSVDASVASSGSSEGKNTRSSSNTVASSAASAVDSPTKRTKKKRSSTSRKLSGGGGTSSGEDKPSTSTSSRAHRSKKLPPTSATASSSSSRPKATSSGDEDAPPKPVRRSRSTDNSAGDTALTKPRRNRSTRGMNEESPVTAIDESNKEELTKDRPVAKKKEDPLAAAATAAKSTGWGSDFATFGSPDGASDNAAFGSRDEAFGSRAFAATDTKDSTNAFGTAFGSPDVNDAFGNFGQGAFSSLANKSLSKSDFEEAFSPSPFEPGNAFDAFGTRDSAIFDSVFSPQKEIKKKPEKVWEKSPLSGKLPKLMVKQLVLKETPVFAAKFSRPPVTNPLNGNIIFCCPRNGSGLFLQEVDPRRGNVQISCTPVLSSEFKRKVGDKYKASTHRVDHVISLAAGLHHANGQARVRVAAILDVAVLESAQILRVLAVWQWGYAAGSLNPIALQYAISPPSSGNFIFDASSLQTADGLLFLAGASPDKGPCLFMCKPSVKETWSANFLGASGRITSMAVAGGLKQSYPYLAIGLSDGSLSVWTYHSALSTQQTKDTSASGPARRWLFPLCRLDHTKWTNSSEALISSEEGVTVAPNVTEIGYCTGFEWLPPQPASSSMLLLAAAFQNGLAVFNIDLPVTKVGSKPLTPSSQGTGLSLSPLLCPIVAKRWQGQHKKSSVSWIDFGPLQGFCLAVLLLQDSSTGGAAHVLFGTMALSSYRKSPISNNRLFPFRVIASKVISTESAVCPVSLLRGLGTSRLYASSETHVINFSLPEKKGSEALSWVLSRPVASQPTGLNASGDPLFVDSEGDKDGVLHIFSVIQCERIASSKDEALLVRGPPLLRLWLVRTMPGDTNHTADTSDSEEKKTDRGFGDVDQVSSGAVSQAVCEIFHEDLEGLIPLRIVRCLSRSLCAIAFRDAVRQGGDGDLEASLDAKAIAFVDYSTGITDPLITVIRARDVVFFPQNGSKEPRGLLLSDDASRITYFEFNTQLKKCSLGSAFRPMIGVEIDRNFVECRRFFAFNGSDKIVFAAVGTKPRENQSCFVIGNLVAIASLNSENFSEYLPNVCTDRICWFEDEEEIVSVIGLEADDSGYRNFAVSTSSRVLILSSALQVSSEVRPMGPCSNLAPLGPFSVSYFSQNKFHYLCCLDGKLASGTFCTLPSRKHGCDHNQLVAVRPDRVLLLEHHVGSRQVELGQNPNVFLLPTATTLPALLLEPMVANAVCVGDKQRQSTPILRTVIEKFGRTVASITHGEDEGIGQFGSGLTPRTFEILDRYGLKQASSWLLTGTVPFERAANSVILPPWLPVAPKMKAGLNSDAFFHVISSGDQYLSDYLRSPDKNMPTTLPKQSGPAAYWCREYANQSLRNGRAGDALKLLDLAGGDATETTAVQLALALGKDKTRDLSGFLKTVSGYNAGTLSGRASRSRVPTGIAALATLLKQSGNRDEPMDKEQIDRWMKPLAPSLQRGCRGPRIRQRVVGEEDLAAASGAENEISDPIWLTPCVEAKHVWNEGPRKEKEHLLMLDRTEDWIGRRRPLILGKEGVSAALDRGEKTLADLLNQDDDSFGDKSDLESEKDDWVEGVGEGRSDEANLVAYFRMSEGENEDSPWRSEGLSDITPYQNKVIVVGDAGSFNLQPSTSSVDEGETGKVKSLYDLVFEKKGIGLASGLAISASRGSSLDVGALLGPERQSRKRCSIEFWYYLPPSDFMWEEMVLARRTLGNAADDLSKVCLASDKESVLWDLCLLKTGELVFRTCSGAVLSSSQNYNPNATEAAKETPLRHDLAVFERWNHVCVVLSSKGLGVSDCNVSICMKGNEVASAKLSMLPPNYDEEDLEDTDTLNGLMQKSHILFGLDHGAGFRMTELRVWACERSADDTQSFLYEYLTAAEAKKKFKVKISQRKGGAAKSSLLAPPKVGAGGPTRGFLATTKSTMVSFRGSAGFSLAPAAQKDTSIESASASASFDTAFDSSFNQQTTASEDAKITPGFSSTFDKNIQQSTIPEEEEMEGQTELWDTALPLSKQVRSSAAAALIRGPPATRHFGGNRGGLPDFSGMDRFGVGGVAICGSEKTIVWRDNEDPPALTYPIGASGAIVSDQMDDMGSEFLCCFLAKEKRMVVFELQSRTVVVELQMTTKLNFWRYLPPEAAENTLCFILITPVGGFHWMPLEESPRPHQVWKRGPSLQDKKVVNYEEGGSNGLDGSEVRSRVGLVMVTKATGAGSLESWVIPVAGDSKAVPLPSNVLGACFCQPPFVDSGAFLPLVVTVHDDGDGNMVVNVLSVVEPEQGSVALGGVEATQMIEMEEYAKDRFEPPALAMGTLPEVICCSLSNILVVIVRRKGIIAAYELEDDDLSLIAQEGVGHYVVDAVMRYSAEVGGAEIVMLLSDNDKPKDGRIVSFCFRSAA